MLQRTPQTADARQVALRLLARRDHAVGELTRKLRERGFAAVDIASVITDFEREGWLSDQRFAESFVRARLERGQGPLRIRADLMQRGLNSELADQALEEACQEDSTLRERAEAARVKRFGPAQPADRRAWGQQARFLAQRGFPADTIRSLFD